MTTRNEALALALEWARRAETAAKDYPHVPSAKVNHVFLATDLATMWAKLAQELDYPGDCQLVEDLELPANDTGMDGEQCL